MNDTTVATHVPPSLPKYGATPRAGHRGVILAVAQNAAAAAPDALAATLGVTAERIERLLADAYPNPDALRQALADRLARAHVNLRLCILGDEAFIWPLHAVAREAGLQEDEIDCVLHGEPRRAVYCVHCMSTHTYSGDAERVVCRQCGAALEVRAHFSCRLGAYLGVCADADQPYASVAPTGNFLIARVAGTRKLTPVIREITLVSPDPQNAPLPGFSAGSHVQVRLPNGRRNAYSLVGDPADGGGAYRIAVRLHENSRGGSRYIHETLKTGDHIQITPPANLFALHSGARLSILIAGGIGITPFVAHCSELLRQGAEFELHYAYRSGVSDAFVDTLRERLGARLHTYDSAATPPRRINLSEVLRDRPLGSHVYACGPQNLLEALKKTALAAGWSAGRVHTEAFATSEPGQPFGVKLAQSGLQLEVGAEESLLEALEAARLEIPNLCRGGACGQCKTRYLQGDVEHRDHCLNEAERAEYLMPCVSRGQGASPLVLDL
jgi:ferredoxin-NADP reductase